jgi:hypothetical protein
MPVTAQQIAAAATALDLQRLQATMQLEDNDARTVERQEQSEYRVATRDLMQRQTVALEKVAANEPSAGQQNYLRLYEIHTKLRLGPTVITTNTADTVMDDIVRDAARMTDLVWDQINAKLQTL